MIALQLAAAVLLGAMGLTGPELAGAPELEVTIRAGDLRLDDLAGGSVDPFAGDAPATVVLFVRSDCPISNRYAPEVRRIYEELAPRGVAFWLVYVEREAPAEALRSSTRAFGYPFPALRDARHELVERTGATVTPEAAVFDAAGRMVYRGRIDDRWAGLGRPRPAPTRHDLEEAAAAAAAGERRALRTTRAIGCFIADLG